VNFDLAPNGGGGGVEVDVFPFCVRIDHFCALVDDLSDLSLVFFGGVCGGGVEVV